jgi:hypothetical protein
VRHGLNGKQQKMVEMEISAKTSINGLASKQKVCPGGPENGCLDNARFLESGLIRGNLGKNSVAIR